MGLNHAVETSKTRKKQHILGGGCFTIHVEKYESKLDHETRSSWSFDYTIPNVQKRQISFESLSTEVLCQRLQHMPAQFNTESEEELEELWRYGCVSAWWFQSPWEILVKLDHFPGRGENKKCLKPPPRYVFSPHFSQLWKDGELNPKSAGSTQQQIFTFLNIGGAGHVFFPRKKLRSWNHHWDVSSFP